MDSTVRVTIRVRKYLWSEFVHDVCYVLYAAIMISNALSKRYLKLSLGQLFRIISRNFVRAFWIFMAGVWSYLLLAGAFGWR